METSLTCSDCRWWHFQAAETDAGSSERSIGYCRRFAPARRENGVGAWPITFGYDWCGEYQERGKATKQVARNTAPGTGSG
jgi:hypothetical protein